MGGPAGSSEFEFDSVVWEWEGPASWHFVSVPPEQADEIVDLTEGRTKGFGSVRVQVTIGRTTWRTSLFPDKRRATFLLPLKKSVRAAEQLGDGSRAEVHLVVLDP